ncbi:MAG TPA: phosphoribosylformylglycinamidine synthase subunit PurS [Tepidisphaeraceae bacterium]|jgi:phosphoribosylformylglycinamidine synthase
MIYRIDVSARPEHGLDRAGDAVRRQFAALGLDVGDTRYSRVFFLETPEPRDAVERIARTLLADPIAETYAIAGDAAHSEDDGRRLEVHLKPGVMDPVANSTEVAVRDMGLRVDQVRTGRAYVFANRADAAALRAAAARTLANGVIEHVHDTFYLPATFPVAAPHATAVRHVPLRSLTDDDLKKLSRDGHLFLSIAEMKAVQTYFADKGRDPTDIELETVAQTWSEHCVHKTLKSAVDVVDENGNVVRSYKNLIKDTIFASTMEIMGRVPGSGSRGPAEGAGDFPRNPEPGTRNPFCLSVFKDNAGVIAFDEADAVCFKVETHNRPSAIEPYGGAATGIGGCIRDVLGTGLGARPIANTDTFCVAYPEREGERGEGLGVRKNGAESPSLSLTPHPSPLAPLPPGVIHPRRVLEQVVAGVRDYGNRMGIPTVNGAVYFDENYVGNPLVFAGCIGILPRDKIDKEVGRGDAIVVMGGRTGRDGIHGATFSSAELTDKHQDEFSHAVQIGNAITQKKMADVLLQARDRGLYSALTDCGAGGLSSAIGEMGGEIGATVELEKVTLKYTGLRYDEIWISEAQERMVLSVPQEHVAALLQLAGEENVEATVIGAFGTPGEELILNHAGVEVGRMAMGFLHDGIPMPKRIARVTAAKDEVGRMKNEKGESDPVSSFILHPSSFDERLKRALSHPNVASKHWIVRQYDHEVQGGTAIKPLVGPQQIGPSDASVIRPKATSMKGVIAACGLAPHVADPYDMALAAIDEAIRNAVCVGADLDRLAILDNFCWPGTDNEEAMGQLVRACEACRDAALAYGVPFISGKDSLHNQFTDSATGRVIKIPPTLLISAIGVIDDLRRCVTMDFKQTDSTVVLIRPAATNLRTISAFHRAMSKGIAARQFAAVHDVADGGIACAIAEMAIASGIGVEIESDLCTGPAAFDYVNGCYIAELAESFSLDAWNHVAADFSELVTVACTTDTATFAYEESGDDRQIPLTDLTAAWRGTLDW